MSAGYGVLESTGADNDRSLAAYCLPLDSRDDFFKDKLILNVRDRLKFNVDFVRKFDSELAEIGEAVHTVIITSEHFHSRLVSEESIRFLSEFVASRFNRVKVVSYFREQSALLLSYYSTAVKTSSVEDFEAFSERCHTESLYFNYYKMFSLWRAVFGAENIVARIYDRNKLVGGDIRKDFVDVLSLDVQNLGYSSNDINTSLGGVGINLIRIINRSFPRYDKNFKLDLYRLRLVQAISELAISRTGEISFLVAVDIYENFSSSNIRFSEEFLGSSLNPFSAPKINDDSNQVEISESDLYELIEVVVRVTSQKHDSKKSYYFYLKALMNKLFFNR
ncbi:hypothetical protein GCM10022414_34450 [Zhongshania borealis]|uniref:Uncharacterized protein n=2 Tax=Zhongshania borealis TaxID=889488 RepID=A0ABP7X7X5_9GAMM